MAVIEGRYDPSMEPIQNAQELDREYNSLQLFGDFFTVFTQVNRWGKFEPRILYLGSKTNPDSVIPLLKEKRELHQRVNDYRRELKYPKNERLRRASNTYYQQKNFYELIYKTFQQFMNEHMRSDEQLNDLINDVESRLSKISGEISGFNFILNSRTPEESLKDKLSKVSSGDITLGRKIERAGTLTHSICLDDLLHPDSPNGYFHPLFHKPEWDEQIEAEQKAQLVEFERSRGWL